MSNMTSASGEASASISSDNYTAGHTSRAKRKRNLPGNPDPDAEVIALSPNSLMATNRFVCQVCNKGFQRDQNLQLHRRGHNLPWKLRQRSGKESRKRVYICPESSCVHHNPSRALGDLTGIKKHFSRKHGEKKWKCDKCSKTYAVQSDWKAHSKTCGTREYRCDCGTLFSRRDSFITHRAFCDALAQEKAIMTLPNIDMSSSSSSSSCAAAAISYSPLGIMSSDENGRVPLWLGSGTDPSNPMDMGISRSFLSAQPPKPMLPPSDYDDTAGQNPSLAGLSWPLTSSSTMGSLYSSLFNPGSSQVPGNLNAMDLSSGMPSAMELEEGATNWSSRRFPSAVMASNDMTMSLPSMYGHHCSEGFANISQMSATALLQKAAQMGAKPSSSSYSAASMERQSEKQHRGEMVSSFVHSHSETMDNTEKANAGLQDMMKYSCLGLFNVEKGFDGMLQTFGESNLAASEVAYGGLIERLAPRNINIARFPQHKSKLQVEKNVNPAGEECEGVTRDFLGVSYTNAHFHT
ncbi:hypothetical protein SUGI_0923500 [Cryptomeria japonica]|uniref:zinc finger protein GAI-ASSOCIATED FACTOR 1 n=1 Tax=Cryptomeria japonica TaxID=3369 RepID=UPI0024148601|nr:zinc finger protein GAI-ASSOCIATED FACTOR 1 [Cryptomeria japonica]GLJ44221.1 hypothetical protein SUGI_0923500 [Cryptomeria japonica]